MPYNIELTDTLVSGYVMRELTKILPKLIFAQRKQYDEYYFERSPKVELDLDLITDLTDHYYMITLDKDTLTIKV